VTRMRQPPARRSIGTSTRMAGARTKRTASSLATPPTMPTRRRMTRLLPRPLPPPRPLRPPPRRSSKSSTIAIVAFAAMIAALPPAPPPQPPGATAAERPPQPPPRLVEVRFALSASAAKQLSEPRLRRLLEIELGDDAVIAPATTGPLGDHIAYVWV